MNFVYAFFTIATLIAAGALFLRGHQEDNPKTLSKRLVLKVTKRDLGGAYVNIFDCPIARVMKRYLRENNIPFRDLDVGPHSVNIYTKEGTISYDIVNSFLPDRHKRAKSRGKDQVTLIRRSPELVPQLHEL